MKKVKDSEVNNFKNNRCGRYQRSTNLWFFSNYI